MAGFENDVLLCKNMNFDTAAPKPHLGILNAGGLLPIGTGDTSPTPEILAGNITSPLGTLTIGYSNPDITIDVAGGAMAVDSFAMQSGTTPVVPDGTGLVTFNGGIGNAGSNPVQTIGTGATTMELRVQTSQALLAGDSGKIGLSNFDSTDFTVSAAGFVELATTGAGKTITGDSGGALSPVANNWNILGLSGSKTSGSGATLTVKSPPYADSTAATLTVNSGTFATAAGAYVLPAAPADGDLCEIVCITTGIIVTGNTGQEIQIGIDVSSSAGTATNSAKGDVLCLRYRATDTAWYATSVVGVWVTA